MFDVTYADDGFYGPEGSYNFLVGHEATNALGHMKTASNGGLAYLDNFENCDEKTLKIAREWYNYHMLCFFFETNINFFKSCSRVKVFFILGNFSLSPTPKMGKKYVEMVKFSGKKLFFVGREK